MNHMILFSILMNNIFFKKKRKNCLRMQQVKVKRISAMRMKNAKNKNMKKKAFHW